MPTYLEIGLVALYAVVVWWGATGLILYLNRRPESTYQSSLWGAAAVAAAGLIGAVLLRDSTDVAGAILGFTCALAIWAFNEMLFLMGVVVGTHREPSPPHERGWLRFKRASLAIAYHELALAASLFVLAAISMGAANATAFWTFALLWAMRLSTKLNIFLGVPNTAEELLPRRIAYLQSFFRTGPASPLFPMSIALSAGAVLVILTHVLASDATAFTVAAGTLLLTFAVLGLIEHLMLIAPFSSGALWGDPASRVVDPFSRADHVSNIVSANGTRARRVALVSNVSERAKEPGERQ